MYYVYRLSARIEGKLKPIAADLWQEVGYTLDSLKIFCLKNTGMNDHSHLPLANLKYEKKNSHIDMGRT